MKKLLDSKTLEVIKESNAFPYNIVSIEKWVDGAYIVYCYTTGIPGLANYGHIQCLEIYFHKDERLEKGHYKSFVYGTLNRKKVENIPTKHKEVFDLLVKKHEELFNIKYTE